MNNAMRFVVLSGIIASAASFTSAQAMAKDSPLDLRPIAMEPDPVGELHPDVQWLKTDRVRGIWSAGGLFDKHGTGDKTKAQVLAEAGFNMVVLYIGVDRKNRDTAPSLDNELPQNLDAAHRHGMKLMAKWQYGSSHLEPYRRYREPGGRLHERTCCPLDQEYVERHVGRWAIKAAERGADGMVFDTEMYESDVTTYSGACVCDDCFATYLKQYARNWESIHNEVLPEKRGVWLNEQNASEHYSRYQAKRIEDQFDALRARCQAIKPGFLFGYAPFLDSFPGLTRGLGTSSHPCLIFSEQEYTSGSNPQSLANIQRVRRDGLPALYLGGHWFLTQTPDVMADNILIASLYGDGWWGWFGAAVMNNVGLDDPDAFKAPYGRFNGTTAADYLDRLAKAHAQLDDLLAGPQKVWPKPRAVPEPPATDVARRAGKISIDGQLDEKAWQSVAQIPLKLTRHALPTSVDTKVRLCWDDQALYVAYESQLPEGTALDVPERGRDNANLWVHDGVEIFIAPNRSTKRYAQFMVSALADVCDLLIDMDAGTGKYGSPAWSTDVQAGATQSEGSYTLEVRIPFKDLATPPKVGDTWGANFYRFIPNESAWSPTYGGFHSPASFGTLRFVDP
jgi:hypothetical protein